MSTHPGWGPGILPCHFAARTTNDYGEQHLAWIAILNVPGIGRNLFSVKTGARKGIVSIDVNKPRLGAGNITVPLRGENDDLYSFKLDLSTDGYAGNQCPSLAPAAGSPQ